MKRRIFISSLATAIFMLFAATFASAQVNWPCPTATLSNNTGCTITLTLNTTPPGAIPVVTLLPGQVIPFWPTPVISIDQVVTAAGTPIPIAAPPPPPLPFCTCGPTDWWVCCVALPPMKCCCDVCFDPFACTININPAACAPGTCTP